MDLGEPNIADASGNRSSNLAVSPIARFDHQQRKKSVRKKKRLCPDVFEKPFINSQPQFKFFWVVQPTYLVGMATASPFNRPVTALETPSFIAGVCLAQPAQTKSESVMAVS